ncbi:MAG: sulfatase [Planctomycetota bacterium]
MRILAPTLTLIAVFLSASFSAAAERPNILFIFSDDHSPQAIGAYQGSMASLDPTPNIDRLAASGVLFRNSFCTNSICGPSRAVVLTGKHSHINGFTANGLRFNPKQPTFPATLNSAGYQTAIVGKWHLGTKPVGFDYWCVLPGQGEYYNPDFLTAKGKITVPGYCTEVVTDMAVDWLDGRDTEKPFLLMCQHKAPHRNWMPGPSELDLYDDVEIPEPASLFDKLEDNASPALESEMSIRDHLHPVYDLFFTGPGLTVPETNSKAKDKSGNRNLPKMTAEQRALWDKAFAEENAAFNAAEPEGDERVRIKYQRYMKNYLRAVRGVDNSVGRLLDYLEKSGLAENTIVVYSSDQGFYLGEHGWYDKRWMYEPSLSMPLIVRWPGVTTAGTVVEEMVQNLDYAPTLLEVGGVQPAEDIQGRSLAPLLRGESPDDWRSSIYYHYHASKAVHRVARHNGVRTDRYKLIHFYETDEWELYDLEYDPKEMQNLYGQAGYESITSDLKTELVRLAKECADETDTSPLSTQ